MDIKEIGNKALDSVVVSEVLVLPGDLQVVSQECFSSLYFDELFASLVLETPYST